LGSHAEITSSSFFLLVDSQSTLHLGFGTQDVAGLCLQQVDELPSPDDVVKLVLSGTWLCAMADNEGRFAVVHEGKTISSYNRARIPTEMRLSSFLCYKLLETVWHDKASPWRYDNSDSVSILAKVPFDVIADAPVA
jgi:hypothetical protein